MLDLKPGTTLSTSSAFLHLVQALPQRGFFRRRRTSIGSCWSRLYTVSSHGLPVAALKPYWEPLLPPPPG